VTESVLYNVHCHVARITLNRPELGNVVNEENLTLLTECIFRAESDSDIRAVVIEGKDGVFSRGMDFRFMLGKSKAEGIANDFGAPYAKAVLAIRNAKKPVIAAVDGETLAGGTGIVLACDIVIATERSVFGLSEVLFGIIPAYVFPLLLERVSLKRARYMVLSSEKLTAADAFRFGIFDELVDNNGLEKALTAVLKRLLFASPDALATVKTYSDDIFGRQMGDAMAAAERQLCLLLQDKRNTDAVQAFLEGEMPSFSVRYKKPAK
jgi:enoyl-CoA hydratase/carnithine racemase